MCAVMVQARGTEVSADGPIVVGGALDMYGLRTNRPRCETRLAARAKLRRKARSPGFARTAVLCAAVCFIWIEAGRDLLLTQHMIRVQGDAVETNIIARGMTWHFGRASLLPYKVGALLAYTTVLGVLMRRNRLLAETLAGVGVVVSAGLAAWWDWIVVRWVHEFVGFT